MSTDIGQKKGGKKQGPDRCKYIIQKKGKGHPHKRCTRPACGEKPYGSYCRQHKKIARHESAQKARASQVEVQGEECEKRRKIFLEVMHKKAGNVSEACAAVGIDRSTYYHWRKRYPEFQEAVEEVNEFLVDFTESKLFGKIQGDNLTAMIFFLKCKGKHRGWVEKSEQEHTLLLDSISAKFDAIIDTVHEVEPDERKRRALLQRIAGIFGRAPSGAGF